MLSAELSHRVARAMQVPGLDADERLTLMNDIRSSTATTFDELPESVRDFVGEAEREIDALTSGAAFHLDGKHDQDSHGRDKPDKVKDTAEPKKGPTKPKIPLKDWKTAKKAKSSDAGKPLKITHMLVHKAHGEPGTVLTENGASDKRVVWDGAEYRLQRKTDNGSWTTEKKVKKSKAYAEVNAYDDDWRVPSSDEQGSDSESEPDLIIDEPAPAPTKPDQKAGKKSAGNPGDPLEVTEELVQKDYAPDTLIAESSDGYTRVLWNGDEYEIQMNVGDLNDPDDWEIADIAPKSEAVAAMRMASSDWVVPANDDNFTDVSIGSTPASPGYSLMDPTLVKQSSSKKGGVFKDKYGDLYNIQPTQSESHAHNQLLASKLYAYAAIGVDHVELVQVDPAKLDSPSGIGVKTNHKPGELGLIDAMNKIPATKTMVNENFAFDAWLGNWDVVGLGYENITVAKNGVARRSNLGGSLLYRANGQPKGAAFGDKVTEIDSLRNPHMNPSAAKVFANVTDDDIRAGVAKIEKITPDDIDYLVSQAGFTGKEADLLSSKLQARRADLISKYGANAPKPASWPATAPAPSTQPTATNALGGTKTYTSLQKAKVKAIFDKHNLKWHNKTDAIYDAAQEVSTTHPDLTMGDALDIMDQSLKKKSGNPFRTKVEKFLKTKAGKQHALTKGGSASLGGTAPKVPPAPTSTTTSAPGNKYVDHGGALPQRLTRTTAGILQQRMDQASPPPWTAAQKAALRKYTGGEYTTINKCARGTGPCSDATKQTLKDINAAMKPSTDDVIVFRKTNPASFGVESGKDLEKMIGKTISDDGVISTSIRSNMWTGKLDIEIEAPKGSMLAWVQPISLHPGEDEIVVAPGTHYEIIAVTPPHDVSFGSYKIKLRIIPGSDAQSRAQAEKLKTQQAIAALQAKKGAK